ncbi:MAG: twin arginine-targeting protein translocase TatB [Rhizobiales bacterium NRL2]|jgi:sec-independent protein translocase protein TatB|nr:MAG: twin arginine-targeting protein translocase TatB [Rhizobiales bacterium NRL2]
MLDLGWSELLVVAVLTVLIFGPKELPTVLRTVSQLLSKARGVARDFQRTMDDMAREAELDKLKKDISDSTRPESLLDPSGSDDGMFDSPFAEPRETPKKPADGKDQEISEGQGEAAASQEPPDAPETASEPRTEPKTAGKAG